MTIRFSRYTGPEHCETCGLATATRQARVEGRMVVVCDDHAVLGPRREKVAGVRR